MGNIWGECEPSSLRGTEGMKKPKREASWWLTWGRGAEVIDGSGLPAIGDAYEDSSLRAKYCVCRE